MKKILVAMAITLMLTACNFDELEDGYQFGDVSHLSARKLADLKQARDDYCTNTDGSLLRKAALVTLRLEFPLIPENGICG